MFENKEETIVELKSTKTSNLNFCKLSTSIYTFTLSSLFLVLNYGGMKCPNTLRGAGRGR